jgi:hypothetical protein
MLLAVLLSLQASSLPPSIDWLITTVSSQNSIAVLLDAFVDPAKGLKLMVLEPQAVVHTYNKYPTPKELEVLRTDKGGPVSQDIEDLLHARASRGEVVCRYRRQIHPIDMVVSAWANTFIVFLVDYVDLE